MDPRDDIDVSQTYQTHSQDTDIDARLEALRRRVQDRQTQAPAPAAQTAAPAAPAAAPAGQQQQRPAVDNSIPPGVDPSHILPGIEVQAPGPGPEPVPPAPITPIDDQEKPSLWSIISDYARRGVSGAATAAGDVGYGTMVEGPSAVGAGMYDGIHNAASGVANAMNATANWLNDHVADLRVGDPQATENNPNATFMQKLAANPVTALMGLLPGKTQHDEKTVTGAAIRDISRFMIGFVPAARAMSGLGLGPIAANVAGGGMGDFATSGPDEKTLANLFQNNPTLGPILKPLMNNPDDPELLNRARTALQGMGLGALGEGALLGVRTLAAARKAIPEIQAQQLLYGGMPRDTIMVASSDAEPLVIAGKGKAVTAGDADPLNKLAGAQMATETGVPADVAAKGVVKSAEDAKAKGLTQVALAADENARKKAPEVYINFGRINQPDDVRQVIDDMAQAFSGDIKKAARGVQSNEQTEKLADQLGMTAEDLLSRTKGQPLNAEQALAARRLLNTSATKLLELSQVAAGPNASLADLYNFRRMMSVHAAIQSEVIAARTETARALQSWSIPAGGGNLEMARNVQLLVDSMGGQPVTAELAKRMALLAQQGVDPAAISNMARRGALASTMDGVKEAFVMGLLWSPSTHLTNFASNTVVSFLNVMDRAVAGKIADTLGSAVDERVVSGEAIAMTYGMISSLQDALRLGARAARTGESGVSIGAKTDIPTRAISSDAIARERMMTAPERQAFMDSPMGRAVDFVGELNGVPGKLLSGSDEFFKTIAYRAEVHAQSLRQATAEGARGPELWRRMMEIANNPPEHIRLAAADAALYSTFQNQVGDFGQALLRLRNSGSLNPTFMVLPFIKTPMNILRYSFEHSPMAPLVGQWREDIAAGGARAQLATARMATGTAIIASATDLANSGYITGPGPDDPGQKEALARQGWQPWSIYVNGKYYSYNRLDPVGTMFAAAATLAETLKAKELAPEDFDEASEIMAEIIGGASLAVVNKTWFQGVENAVTMIKGSEKGDGAVANYMNRQAGSMLPFNSLLNTARRAVDPAQREINSPMDAVLAKIPGLSSRLPPSMDLWGRERSPDEVYGRAFDIMSPMAVSKQQPNPIDAELGRLGIGIDRIKSKTNFMGVQVNFHNYPQVYAEYVKLAGNGLKHPAWGMGAMDFLNSVVTGQSPVSLVYDTVYSDGEGGSKATFIQNTINEYRNLAQQKIWAEAETKYPEFYREISQAKAEADAQKLPKGVQPLNNPNANKAGRAIQPSLQ